ncbi:MAG TPA: c-type cytochrome [Thermoanaerobaculia bacterium]
MKTLKRLSRLAVRASLVVATLALLFVAVVLVRSHRTFDAPYPELSASSDPAVIERGRYLAYGPAHCVNCHTANDEGEAVKAGKMIPLAGGHLFDLPFGRIYTNNLTPDPETGIGRYTDQELARVLRHGVRRDGRAAVPFMEAQNMSDEDLVAIISFLRSQEPVRRLVPDHDFNLLGKALTAFMFKPVGPSRPVLAETPLEGTAERGEYLATSVASCASCHTRRNMLTGRYEAAEFAGGFVFDLDEERVIVTPNLTPARVGRITTWDEEQFVGRFGAGVGIEGSHMPWRQFQKMSDADLRAIYRYLRSLDPVEADPGPSIQRRAELKQRKGNA